jgi:signal transduction histidine kinase
MGLYMAVGGVALLAAAYFALTRWIVRPILTLEQEAGRTQSGGRLRQLERAPRELMSLSRKLADMTERLRQDEEALLRKIDELEARTDELREAQASLVRSERLATVGRLAAGLAHEVGNPISALMGLQDLMMTGHLSSGEQKDFLERMRKETERIDRVLSDLLAYARPGGGAKRGRGDDSPGDLPQAIADVLALLDPQGGFREVRLQTRIEQQVPAVPMSQEELTQVLLNLVMNAADACDKNGQVLVSAQATAGKIRLIVEDDGPGIPTQIRDSLFEPFVTTKEVGKGTGLGLAVTRGLVEAAGGEVFVETSDLGGARFVIDFPPVKAHAVEPPHA